MPTPPTNQIKDQLSDREEMFALAVIEFSGNIAAAFAYVHPDETSPMAKGREMLTRPPVIARVLELQAVSEDSVLLTKATHLMELANLRDLCKGVGQFRTSLEAERLRGEVVGFYSTKDPTAGDQNARIRQVRETLRAAVSAIDGMEG